MDIKTLTERIAKKEKDIEKINRRINKHSVGLTDEQKSAALISSYSEFRKYLSNHPEIEYSDEVDELRRAYRDLSEATVTLNKYKNQLALEQAKEETTKVQVIVDFLENWKEDVKDFIKHDILNADLYFEWNHKWSDLHNYKFQFIRDHGEEAWKDQMRKAKEMEKHYLSITNPLTLEVYWKDAEDHIDHEELDKILDKEAEAKYWNMVEKITAITGEINDASNLKIGGDGNINGIIIGDKGKARLETIRTTGENAGIIVNVKRGSIAHFRLLVHEVK